MYRIALWETFGDAFTSFASFNRCRISAVGGAFDRRAGCRGFDSRGWTNPRVLKITGTSFALQTTGTSRGLGGHVKWWSCFQQETKISDLNKYFQVTSCVGNWVKSLSHSAIRHRPSVTRSIIIATSSERLAVRYDNDVGY